jgi:hypothetical protein
MKRKISYRWKSGRRSLERCLTRPVGSRATQKKKNQEIMIKTNSKEPIGDESYRIPMLTHMTTAPGLWMHIVTILRLPTNFVDHVLRICGINWKAESSMDDTPRNVAQRLSAVEGGETCCVPSKRKVTRVHRPLGGYKCKNKRGSVPLEIKRRTYASQLEQRVRRRVSTHRWYSDNTKRRWAFR